MLYSFRSVFGKSGTGENFGEARSHPTQTPTATPLILETENNIIFRWRRDSDRLLTNVPLHRLVKTVAFNGRRLEDLVAPVLDARQTEGVGHLGDRHRSLDVLLVGEHNEDGLLQLVLLKQRERTTSAPARRGHPPETQSLTQRSGTTFTQQCQFRPLPRGCSRTLRTTSSDCPTVSR